jgi:hypothetical protein
MKTIIKTFLLWLLTLGVLKAQQFTYSPNRGTYTVCNNPNSNGNTFANTGCSIAGGSTTYNSNMFLQVSLVEHNPLTGFFRFRISRCMGSGSFSQSGRAFIDDILEGVVRCATYNANTSSVDITISSKNLFAGNNTFRAYIISDASPTVNRFYAGEITITNNLRPTLISPANNATNISTSPKLIWRKIHGNNVNYELQWQKIGGVVQTITTTDTSYSVSNLDLNAQYTWNVKAKYGTNINTPWSSPSTPFVFTTQPQSFTIAASANPINGGSVSGTGSFAQGSSVTLTATPNASWSFSNWTENGNPVSTSASYTFTANSNRNLVANFQAAPSFVINPQGTQNVSNTAGSGSITVTSNVLWTASSDQSWLTLSTLFGSNNGAVNYNYAANSTTNSRQANINLNGNGNIIRTLTIVQAAGAAPTFTIMASANPSNGGSVSGGGTFQQNIPVNLTATANAGWNFVNWTENGNPVSTNATFSFAATSNRTLVANFQQQIQNFTITTSANPSNGGSVSGGGTFQQNANVNLTATANAGWNFVNWTENGNPVSTNATFSFAATSNRTLVANFQQQAPNTVATPTFSPAAGTYTSTQNVSLSTTTTGATIRYTTDGTDVTATSTIYSTPIAISQTTTLKAKAYRSGWTDSQQASATYTINSITPKVIINNIPNLTICNGGTWESNNIVSWTSENVNGSILIELLINRQGIFEPLHSFPIVPNIGQVLLDGIGNNVNLLIQGADYRIGIKYQGNTVGVSNSFKIEKLNKNCVRGGNDILVSPPQFIAPNNWACTTSNGVLSWVGTVNPIGTTYYLIVSQDAKRVFAQNVGSVTSYPINKLDLSRGGYYWKVVSIPPNANPNQPDEKLYSSDLGSFILQMPYTKKADIIEDGSGNEAYKENLNCQYEIRSNGELIELHFLYLSIESGDILTVYEVQSNFTKILAKFTNKQDIKNVEKIRTSNNVILDFKTDNKKQSNNTSGGFKINYVPANITSPLYGSFTISYDEEVGKTKTNWNFLQRGSQNDAGRKVEDNNNCSETRNWRADRGGHWKRGDSFLYPIGNVFKETAGIYYYSEGVRKGICQYIHGTLGGVRVPSYGSLDGLYADDTYAWDANLDGNEIDWVQSIFAIDDGEIILNKNGFLYVNHGGYISGYVHLRDNTTQTTVKKGDYLGKVSNVGMGLSGTAGTHLHFAVYNSELTSYNPEIIQMPRIGLLPKIEMKSPIKNETVVNNLTFKFTYITGAREYELVIFPSGGTTNQAIKEKIDEKDIKRLMHQNQIIEHTSKISDKLKKGTKYWWFVVAKDMYYLDAIANNKKAPANSVNISNVESFIYGQITNRNQSSNLNVKTSKSILSGAVISVKVADEWLQKGITDAKGICNMQLYPSVTVGDSLKVEANGCETLYTLADSNIINTERWIVPMLPTKIPSNKVMYPSVVLKTQQPYITQPRLEMSVSAQNIRQYEILAPYKGDDFYTEGDSLVLRQSATTKDFTFAYPFQEGDNPFSVRFIGTANDTVFVPFTIRYIPESKVQSTTYAVTFNCSSNVQGADLYVNNEFVRSVSQAKEELRLPFGLHRIGFLKNGYLEETFIADSIASFNVSLLPNSLSSLDSGLIDFSRNRLQFWRSITIENSNNATGRVSLRRYTKNYSALGIRTLSSEAFVFRNLGTSLVNTRTALLLNQITTPKAEDMYLLHIRNGREYRKIPFAQFGDSIVYDAQTQKVGLNKLTIVGAEEYVLAERQAPTINNAVSLGNGSVSNIDSLRIPIASFFNDPDKIPNDITVSNIAANREQLIVYVQGNQVIIKGATRYNGSAEFSLTGTHDGLSVVGKYSLRVIGLNPPANFKISPNSNLNVLSWTSNNTIHSGFIIERSTDNVNFTEIARVASTFTTFADNTVSTGTKYYYRVRAFNAGGTSEAAFADVVTSIADELLSKATKVYPNPSEGVFVVEIDNAHNENISFMVTDALGREVQNAKGKFTNPQTIDLSKEANGTYHLIISNGKGKTVKSLVKE